MKIWIISPIRLAYNISSHTRSDDGASRASIPQHYTDADSVAVEASAASLTLM